MAENPAETPVVTHLGVGAPSLPVNASALLASGDFKAADPLPIVFPTLGAVGLMVFVNMTIASGAGNTVTVFLDTFDPVSGTWIPVGAGVALTSAVQAFVVTFDPRIATAAGKGLQTAIPDQCRLRFARSGTTTTLTYSAGAALCL